VKLPAPTRTTAFLAGASLSVIAGGLSAHDADGRLFPFILVYFVVTAVVFVIGVRNLAPREMKTKVLFMYFPTNREGWRLEFEIWRRMALWFLGFATAGGALALVSYGLQ
jgi:hypothetical protein